MNIAYRSRNDWADPSLRRARALEALGSRAGDRRSSREPGTYACYGLLDRLAPVADNLDEWIIPDPTCLMSPTWSAKAAWVLDTLRVLDREVGDAQPDGEDRPWSQRHSQGNLS